MTSKLVLDLGSSVNVMCGAKAAPVPIGTASDFQFFSMSSVRVCSEPPDAVSPFIASWKLTFPLVSELFTSTSTKKI
jgi:hypothetical protein